MCVFVLFEIELMINELKLKGNDLILFSIIYGFSQDKNSEFTGSLSYLCESLSCTRNTAIKSIKRLLDSKYIIKKQVVVSGVTFNKYSVNDGVVQKLTLGSAKVDTGVVQKMHGGSAKNAPNNTINNTNINNTSNNSKNAIDLDDKSKELLKYWIGYRKTINKSIKSEETILALSKKIKSKGYEVSYNVINNSIENGYTGLFWEKVNQTKKASPNKPMF